MVAVNRGMVSQFVGECRLRRSAKPITQLDRGQLHNSEHKPFYLTGTDNRSVGADIGQIISHQNDWKGTN
jgi:hypothetical protein